MTTLQASFAIFAKDVTAERRTKEVFNTMVVFALVVIVIFSFAFEPTAEETRSIASGLLWVAFLFAGILGLNRSFAREMQNDCLEGLRLAPVDPAAICLGKMLGNLAFMLVAELIILPFFAVFYNMNLFRRAGWLALILLLGTWGVAATGTIFAAIAANTRMRELMLPVLFLPVSVPLLIALVEATAVLLSDEPMAAASLWLKLMVGFDVVFTTLALFGFGYVLEE